MSMNTDTSQDSTLLKAVRMGALYAALAGVGLIVLILAAIYLPGNWLGKNESHYGRVFDLLPDPDAMPVDLIQVASYTTANRTVANNSSNPEKMLKQLDSWGREISVTRTYQPVERCRLEGVRSLRVSAVQHKTAAGAQAYYEYIRQEAEQEGAHPQAAEAGAAGYWFQQPAASPCTHGGGNLLVGVVFQRENVIGTVYVQAAEQQAQAGEMQRLAQHLARLFDKRIAAKTGP